MTIQRIAAVLVLGTLAVAPAAIAQCRPPANSHEARLLAFYEAPIEFSMAAAPERLMAGAVRIGGEAIPVPSPNPVLQQPNYCYANTTTDSKLAPLFGRPRLTVGLPAGLALEASYLPQITIAGAQPNLGSIALSRIQSLSFAHQQLALMVRAHLTAGRVRGAITCPRASLQTTDSSAPCYGTEPSRDTFHPSSYGLEGALGLRRAAGRIALYLGGGVSALRPRFRTGFTDALGNVDRTAIAVDLVRGSAFAGATARLGPAVALSAQVYSVPADVTTLRVGAQYRLR